MNFCAYKFEHISTIIKRSHKNPSLIILIIPLSLFRSVMSLEGDKLFFFLLNAINVRNVWAKKFSLHIIFNDVEKVNFD